ncbi:MAG: hypothetical protein O7B23_03995 [Deltaproteobacteria bacterium]|nr:hypothetical protein [Deltaproteobacteria bacterium]
MLTAADLMAAERQGRKLEKLKAAITLLLDVLVTGPDAPGTCNLAAFANQADFEGFRRNASDESGRYEVYVQPYPGPGRRWPISTNGGREPVWSPTGNELYYRAGDSMMVVAFETDSLFTAGVPRSLFEWRF